MLFVKCRHNNLKTRNRNREDLKLHSVNYGKIIVPGDGNRNGYGDEDQGDGMEMGI